MRRARDGPPRTPRISTTPPLTPSSDDAMALLPEATRQRRTGNLTEEGGESASASRFSIAGDLDRSSLLNSDGASKVTPDTQAAVTTIATDSLQCSLSTSSNDPVSGSNLTTKRKKKKPNRRPTSTVPPAPPVVAAEPLIVPVRFGNGSFESSALVDSGAQAEVISPALVHRLHLPVRRLDAPVHASLASGNDGVRLALFAVTDVRVGDRLFPQRSFFVAPLPDGIDAILGTPFMKDLGYAVLTTSLFVAPDGPSSDVYDFETKSFCSQPNENLRALGFTDCKMTNDEFDDFLICSMTAGVQASEFDELYKRIGFEPRNPLLDIDDDDPASADLSEDEARAHLDQLLAEFGDVFVDELPKLPPF